MISFSFSFVQFIQSNVLLRPHSIAVKKFNQVVNPGVNSPHGIHQWLVVFVAVGEHALVHRISVDLVDLVDVTIPIPASS